MYSRLGLCSARGLRAIKAQRCVPTAELAKRAFAPFSTCITNATNVLEIKNQHLFALRRERTIFSPHPRYTWYTMCQSDKLAFRIAPNRPNGWREVNRKIAALLFAASARGLTARGQMWCALTF